MVLGLRCWGSGKRAGGFGVGLGLEIFPMELSCPGSIGTGQRWLQSRLPCPGPIIDELLRFWKRSSCCSRPVSCSHKSSRAFGRNFTVFNR
jgi:hypothetical protein